MSLLEQLGRKISCWSAGVLFNIHSVANYRKIEGPSGDIKKFSKTSLIKPKKKWDSKEKKQNETPEASICKILRIGSRFFEEYLTNIRVPENPKGVFRARKTLFSN